MLHGLSILFPNVLILFHKCLKMFHAKFSHFTRQKKNRGFTWSKATIYSVFFVFIV